MTAETNDAKNGGGNRSQPQGVSSRLTTRLKSLLPLSSKETLQTLSKWIVFHCNRHANSLCKSLLENLQSEDDDAKKVVYLSIIHEILIMNNNAAAGGGSLDADNRKWEQNSEFRLSLGESVLRPFLEEACRGQAISANMKESLKVMKVVWEDIDCFGSPTLLFEISRLINGSKDDINNNNSVSNSVDEKKSLSKEGNQSKCNENDTLNRTSTVMEVDEQEKEDKNDSETSQIHTKQETKPIIKENPALTTIAKPNIQGRQESLTVGTDNEMLPEADDEVDNVGKNDDNGNSFESPEKSGEHNEEDTKRAAASPATTQAILQEKDFDFESEGILHSKVEIQQFQAPCKSIATMQITRDLHSDTAHNVSSILSTVPTEVAEACKNKDGVDKADLSSIPDAVLDLNFKQILLNIRSHREIIKKQQEERKKLIDLLIQSRCKFGSEDAAQMYYGLRETIEKLRCRKLKVLDAMELEGLDFERIDGDDEKESSDKGEDNGLRDFEWLTREEAEVGRDKMKVG